MSAEAKVLKPSAATLELLHRRKVKDGVGCQLCTYILEDLELHGRLTGYPLELQGGARFPVESKLTHLELERR
jgi:hypothetical protein